MRPSWPGKYAKYGPYSPREKYGEYVFNWPEEGFYSHFQKPPGGGGRRSMEEEEGIATTQKWRVRR